MLPNEGLPTVPALMAKPNESKTFCVSDESINSYGIRVLTGGIDTSAFESNPVMLFMHKRGKVFGSWANLVKRDGKVYADPMLDDEDTDEEVKAVTGKVNRGFLKAASIGIEIQEVVYNQDLSCYDVVRSALEEISLVDIGSNRNAIRLYKAGEPLTELQLATQLAEVRPISDPTTTNTTMLNLKTLALAAGLADTATEDEVSRAIVQLKADSAFKAKYEALVKDQQDKQAKLASDLVDAALADKRIGAEMKESYLALFKLDHDGTAKILASISKPVDLVQLAKQGGTTMVATTDEPEKAWEAHDRKGTLLKLKAENPTEFKRLFKAKFGTDYKE